MRRAKDRATTFAEVDAARFRISISEPDPLILNREHEPVTGYAAAVAALETFVEHITRVLEAARDPFAADAAALLEHGLTPVRAFDESNASSILWDAGRALRIQHVIANGGVDPRVLAYEQEKDRQAAFSDEYATMLQSFKREPIEYAPPVGMFDEPQLDDGTASRFDLRSVAPSCVPELTAALRRALAAPPAATATTPPPRRRPQLRVVARAPARCPDHSNGAD